MVIKVSIKLGVVTVPVSIPIINKDGVLKPVIIKETKRY